MFCAGLSLSIVMLLARNAWGKSLIHFRTACLKGKEYVFKTIVRTLNEASQLGTFTWVEVPKTMKLESLLLSLLRGKVLPWPESMSVCPKGKEYI